MSFILGPVKKAANFNGNDTSKLAQHLRQSLGLAEESPILLMMEYLLSF